MKLSTFEKYLIASPILVNLVLPFSTISLDKFLGGHVKYTILALIMMSFYSILPGWLLKFKESLVLYLLMHCITALLSIYVIFNDSALIYLYVSLGVFTISVFVSFLFRKKSS